MMQDRDMRVGPFELEDLLGKGGMGEVWGGYHMDQGVPVAIKVILRHGATQRAYLDAFEREIQTIAKLNHPAIITLLDYGLITPNAAKQSNGWLVEQTPYLAMELAKYGSLDRWLNELNWQDIATILFIVLDALAHAHAHGVIHRDLKPQNLLVGFGTRALLKLTDFGLAHPQFDDKREGQYESVWGTPAYMAPEQIKGDWRAYGPWTDLYALGCMTYKMVTGKTPFHAEDASVLWQAHLHAPVPRWTPRIEVPDELERWMLRLLHKAPRSRFDYAADAAASLLKIYQNHGGEDPRQAQFELQHKLRHCFESTQEGYITREELTTSTPIGQLSALQWQNIAEDRTQTALNPQHHGIDSLWTIPTVRPDATSLDDEQWDRYFQSLTEPVSHHTRPIETEIAPMSNDWRTVHDRLPHQPENQLLHTGIHLHEWRRMPLIGRESERDELWAALAATYVTNSPHLVVVEGEAGVGKTRLAQWFTTRAHERGTAHVLTALHSQNDSVSNGIVAMVARHFQVMGLDHKQAQLRIKAHLDHHGRGTAEHFLEMCQVILEQDPDYRQSMVATPILSPYERYHIILSYLMRLSRDRPTIVLIDDIQWGAEALLFLRYILRQAQTVRVPLLFVVTHRLSQQPQETLEEQLLTDLIAHHDETTHVPLEPLDDAHFRILIEQLLPLTPSLIRQIEVRAHGMPMYAIELISHWIRNERLESTPQGFALKPGDNKLPDDIDELMQQRLEHISNRMPLFVAAILGMTVKSYEWRSVLNALDHHDAQISLHDLEQLKVLRLIGGATWQFTHNMLRESLHHQARQSRHWRAIHEACASTIKVLYRDLSPHQERLAYHLLNAGDQEGALASLYHAAQRRHERTEVLRALRLLDRHDAIADSLGLPDHHSSRLEAMLLRSALYDMQGLNLQAIICAKAVQDLAALHGPTSLVPRAILERAWATLHHGQTNEAEEWLQFVLTHHGDDITPTVSRASHLGLARVAQRRGALTEAKVLFKHVLEEAQRAQDLRHVAISLNGLGDVARQAEHMDMALQFSKRALIISKKLGSRFLIADCLNDLAQWYRQQGQYDHALTLARRAMVIFDSMESTMSIRVALEIAHIHLTTSDRRAAFMILQEPIENRRAAQDQNILPLMLLTQCPHLAAVANWDKLEHHLTEALQLLTDSQRQNTIVPWLAEQIMRSNHTLPESIELLCAQLQAFGLFSELSEISVTYS